MIALIVIIALIFFFSWLHVSKQNKRINRIKLLKQNYDEALKGNDKKVALDKGRLYFASLRKDNRLTTYDEQALTNDLSSMKS